MTTYRRQSYRRYRRRHIRHPIIYWALPRIIVPGFVIYCLLALFGLLT
jgi:hypothetical protein